MPPSLTLKTQGGQLKFRFIWPAQYVNRFEFALQASAEAVGPDAAMITPPLFPLGGDRFELQTPVSTDAAQFYRLTVKFRN